MSLHEMQRLLQEDLGSTALVSLTPGNLPRLELHIPWCKRTLHWQVLLSNPPNLHAPDFIFGEDPSFQPLCGSLPSAQLSSLQQALLAWPQLPAMATNPAAATTGSMQQLLLPEETAGSSAVSGSSSGSSSSAQSAPSVPSAPVMAKALAALLRSLLSHFRDHHLGRLALAAAADERLAFELSMLPTTAPPAAVSTSPNEPDLKLAGTNDQYPKPGGASVEITSGGEGAASGMAAPVSGAAGPAEAGSGGQPAVHSALEVMYVEARDGEPPKACFGIPLQGLDPVQLGKLQPGLDTSAFKLQVAFKIGASRYDPLLSLELPSSLTGPGGLPGIQLPNWDPHSCLMEYVPQVSERVRQAVATQCEARGLRLQLLDALSAALGGNRPLEVCAADGSGLWSVGWEGQPVLLAVSCLPSPSSSASSSSSSAAPSFAFPEEQPLITLTNIRSLGSSPDAVKSYRTYPWSPRWPPQEMASRIATFLAAELPLFLGLKPAAPPIATGGTQAAAAAGAAH